MDCPRCSSAMNEHTLGGHLGRSVAIDVCDALPVALVRRAREPAAHAGRHAGRVSADRRARREAGPAPTADTAKCPRCRGRLRKTQDMQRSTRFEYYRCPNGHGRLRDLLRLPEGEGLRATADARTRSAALRQTIQMVNCSNCGAPIDLVEGIGLPALRLAALDAGPEASRDAGRRSCARPIAPTSRSTRRCRWPWPGRDGKRKKRLWGYPKDDFWLQENLSFGLVGAGPDRAGSPAQTRRIEQTRVFKTGRVKSR